MKRTLKIVLCFALAAVMLLAFAGCKSSEMTWSAKYDGETLPIGTYIYFLAYSASEASSKAEDTETAVLKQQIEGQDAETWIRERAQFYIRNYFAVQKMMKDRSLTLSADELAQANTTATSYWSQMSATLSDYGVAFTSYEKTVQEQVAISLLFDAIYGDGGEIETPVADIKEYLEANYYSYHYAIIGLFKEGEDGTSTMLEGDEITAAVSEIDSWIEEYNSGAIDLEGFRQRYIESAYFANEETEPEEYELGETTGRMDESTDFGKALVNAEIGKAVAVDYSSSGVYYVIFKDDIKEQSTLYVADDSHRLALIAEMRQSDFDTLVEEAGKGLEIEYNEKAISKQDVSKFFAS